MRFRALQGSGGRPAGRYERCAGLASLVLAAVLATGCNEDEALRTFRDASTDGLRSGVISFFEGVANGLFAVYELGPDGAADDSGGGEAAGE